MLATIPEGLRNETIATHLPDRPGIVHPGLLKFLICMFALFDTYGVRSPDQLSILKRQLGDMKLNVKGEALATIGSQLSDWQVQLSIFESAPAPEMCRAVHLSEALSGGLKRAKTLLAGTGVFAVSEGILPEAYRSRIHAYWKEHRIAHVNKVGDVDFWQEVYDFIKEVVDDYTDDLRELPEDKRKKIFAYMIYDQDQIVNDFAMMGFADAPADDDANDKGKGKGKSFVPPASAHLEQVDVPTIIVSRIIGAKGKAIQRL